MTAAEQNSAVTQGSGEEPIIAMKLFLGYALVFLGGAFYLLLIADIRLWIAGAVFEFAAWMVLTRARRYPGATHIASGLAALAVVIFVPVAATYSLIKKSAVDIAGDNYCLYQERPDGPPVLTRSVTGLSFIAMLGRKSRSFTPAHAALITKDRLWLWSFQRASFVPWQRIVMDKGTPSFDGRPTMGRPSPDQVQQCFKELNLG